MGRTQCLDYGHKLVVARVEGKQRQSKGQKIQAWNTKEFGSHFLDVRYPIIIWYES